MPKVTVLVPAVQGAKKRYARGEHDMPASDVKMIQEADKARGTKMIEVHRKPKAVKKQ